MALEKMKFYLVKPQAATNYVTNPTPYLATTGYTAVTGTIALTDDASRRGPGCIEVTPTTAESGVYFGTVAVVNTQDYAFSVDVKGETGKAMRIRVEDAGGTYTYETEFTATGNWQRVSVEFTAQETASDYRLYVLRDATTGTNVFYVDGFQFEDDEETTFFSGDTQGFDTGRLEFGWNGTPGASTSYRTVNTNAGGMLVDLDDYSKLSGIFGLGAGNYTQLLTDLISGGSYYQGNIRKSRIFSLLLHYTGSMAEIQANRKAVLDLVKPTGQEMVVRYQGFAGIEGDGDEATEPLDIVCVPQPSHGDPGQRPAQQEALLNFTALSGVLNGAYKEGKELGVVEVVGDSRYIIQRSPEGAWSDVAGGLNGSVNGLLIDGQGDLVAVGNFTNAGGNSDADYIAKLVNGVWTNVGTGLNGEGRDVVLMPNGDLIVTGAFTLAGGIANTSRIARWDGSTWQALGTGLDDGIGRALAISNEGFIYVGGSFNAAGGVADTEKIAMWNGVDWQSVGDGANNTVFALIVDKQGRLYAGGTFTQAGTNASAQYIAMWDGEEWRSVGDYFSAGVASLTVHPSGDVYAGSRSREGVARWNGLFWEDLKLTLEPHPDYPDLKRYPDTIGHVSVDELGRLIVGGDSYITDEGIPTPTEAPIGGIFHIYKEGSWLKFPLFFEELAVGITSYVDNKDRVFIGYQHINENIVAGISTQLAISSHVDAFPTFRIIGPGVMQSVTNYTTGKDIQFDGLTLLADETLTMRLDPTRLSITSNFRGNCMRYVIPGSDKGAFYLQPGENSIAFFMPSGTTADTKAYIEYTPKFDGIEGALHE